MKRVFLLLLLFTSCLVYGQGQERITGKVTDDGGGGVPGVSVTEKGTLNGAITNFNGEYFIEVSSKDAVLSFSFIGFETQEITINGRTNIDVVLVENVTEIDEVVIVGYGEMRKSDVTGSIAKVKASDEEARQYGSVDALLQGRVSGVSVSSNAGSPGSAISVRIRGINSLRGNNEPLYVVDGIIINSAGEDVVDAVSEANELQSPQNGLTGINPRDIESIEILKDASATAIYGSRGANGVVLITTKQGKTSKSGKANISAYGSVELSWMAKDVDLLGAQGYADYQNEYGMQIGNQPIYHTDHGEIYPITYDANGVPTIGATPYQQINWQDEIYEMGISHNEGLTVSGVSKKTKYYFSAGFTNQKGIVESSDIKRGDLRLNLSQNVSSKLKLNTRLSMMYQSGNFAQSGSKMGGNRSFTKQVMSYRPLVGFTDEENDDLELEISNPYAWLTDFEDKSKELRINAATSLEYKLVKGLKYKFNAGLDYRNKDRSKWHGIGIYKGQKDNGSLALSYLDRYSYVIDNLLMFKRTFNEDHSINTTLGITYDGSHITNKIYEVKDFPVKTLRAEAPELGQTILTPLTINPAEETMQSYLGRVNYSYRNRYVFTASFRADGSSKFAKGNRFGYFPAAAFAWRLSEENFIKGLNVFDNFKLRLGWGKTGNQGISPYQTISNFSSGFYVDANGNPIIANSSSNIANPNLTWETTNQYNTGLDLSFFNGRLNSTLDMYYKETVDLLQNIAVGKSNGYSYMTTNLGEIENKGIELAVNGIVIEKKDVSLEFGGHISFNRNKVQKLGLNPSSVWSDGVESQEVFYLGNNVSTGGYFKAPANVYMEGQPIGMFWGYKTKGIYQNDEEATAGSSFLGNPAVAGDVAFIDQNNDGNINDLDKTFIGNPNPDFTYGFNMAFRYKNLSISMLFEGVYGNEVANGYLMELGFAEGNSKNILKDAYEKAWRPSDSTSPDGYDYPRLGYDDNEYFTDRIVEDGSYLRLSNLTIGYELPIKWKNGLEKVNLYLTGKNLFTLTNYSGYDPQVTSFMFDGTIMGVDWTGTPNATSVMCGVNLTF